jgi:hypothetical protein
MAVYGGSEPDVPLVGGSRPDAADWEAGAVQRPLADANNGTGPDEVGQAVEEEDSKLHADIPPDEPPDGDVVLEGPESGDDGDSDAGDSGFEPGQEAPRYAEEATAAYDEVRSDLRRLREDLVEMREEIDRLTVSVEAQIAAVRETLRAGSGQSPDRALQLTAGQAALVEDVNDAEASARGAGQSLWDKIRHWLGRAGRKLWAMITHLVRVKEWSLTGTVGTGVLGLAEASISVTFG